MRAMVVAVLAWAGMSPAVSGEEKAPPPASKDEPMAPAFSRARATAFLDHAAVAWTRARKCGTCHTNVPFLMARSVLKEGAPAEKQVRTFFEQRVANWDREKRGDAPRWDTEVVVTAVALAVSDAHATGKLHPLTRRALDRMWRLQQKDGAWSWLKCEWPPMEHDDYFGAVFAAVGVGSAPDGYAKGESARAGLEQLKGYLARVPAPNLHHKAWLLWGATRLDGLMTREQRDRTVRDLLARQRVDGGWSLHALGDWIGVDERRSDPNSPSDGYGTGLVVYVLRQAGLPAAHPALKRGVGWLKANQRRSGRWFTHSLNADRVHYISNAGSAFALMALAACE